MIDDSESLSDDDMNLVEEGEDEDSSWAKLQMLEAHSEVVSRKGMLTICVIINAIIFIQV